MAQLDIDNLFTAIVTAVGGVSGLSGKVYFDQVPEGVARPFCRFSVVGDTHQGIYGSVKNLDRVQIQFSVFADSLATANSTTKAINSLFHASSLTLTGQISVGCLRAETGMRVKVVAFKPGVTVYHASSVIEFWVQS